MLRHAPHSADGDHLLATRLPPIPSDAELAALMAVPPLAYGKARAGWSDRYPTRMFCAVCGYWGRVGCLKCGARVCALDCLNVHREECVTRYGL
jgi:zinc finger HIT domain-containing protein 1